MQPVKVEMIQFYNITKYQITWTVLLSFSLSKLKHTHMQTHSNNTNKWFTLRHYQQN